MKNGSVTVYDKDGNLIRGYEDMPPQFLKGWAEFYKLKFKVTPDVLIPRPETELLIDEVLSFIGSDPKTDSMHTQSAQGRTLILDIGTGSGNIAISLAKNLPKAKILARENAKKHRVEKKILFINSDLLSAFRRPEPRLNRGELVSGSNSEMPKRVRHDGFVVPDIIISNLPYIPTYRISYLEPSVKDFEPWIALDGGSDGFDLYRKLFQQISHKFLPSSLGVNVTHTGGVVVDRHAGKLELIVCEIDYTQGEIAVIEAQKYFPTAKVEVKTDLAKKQRILRISF